MNFLERISAKQLGIGIFIASMAVTQFIAFRIYKIEMDNERHHVEHEAIVIRDQLESALSQISTATTILAYLGEKRLLSTHFDSISKDLIEKNRNFDALQIVEGQTITHTYPLEGNESVIGYEVLRVSEHHSEAAKAFNRNRLYFEGPFLLKQGWVGFVGRQPIHQNGRLWGYSAALVKKKTFLSAMGIDSTGHSEHFHYQLFKLDSNGTTYAPLFNHSVDMTSGMTYTVPIPQGDWILTVKTKTPSHWARTLPFSLLGLFLSTILGLFAFIMAKQPARLRKLVSERTRQLRLSKNEVEQFAYVSSHELQEPLRIILSHIKHIRDKYDLLLEEKAKRHLGFAIESADRMNRIILDLMTFAKSGTQEEAIETVDLANKITYFQTLYRKIIAKKKAKLLVNSDIPIRTKPIAFNQVLECLIGNALTYTRPDVPPVVLVSTQESEESWTVIVEDNGAGISSEHLESLFNLFVRVDDHGRAGTGIGLSVAKKIVNHLGGHIWVESELGKGSRFYFTIPKQDQSDF